MCHVMRGIAAYLLLSAGVVFGAEVSRDTADKVKRLDERAAKMVAGKTGEYAKENLEVARATVAAAQAAVTVGNEKLALQKVELADLQLAVADARAAEKELVEQVALSRAELKKLEAQLERYIQGEEK